MSGTRPSNPFKRLLTVLALLFAAIVLISPASATAIKPRPATVSEAAGLRQAVFDYFFTNTLLASTVITRIRVEMLATPEPLRSRSVTKYAAITLHAFDASGQDVGYDLALAVFYSSPAKGWRVYNNGSSDVGCDAKWYPVGQQRAIMGALGLKCH